MGCLLRAEALSLGYGAIAVVRDLTLEVNAGEVVALLGANGAGKTSTLLGLAGELPAMRGTVYWRERPTTAPMHRRCQQGLAFVTEERTIFPSLSTADNLRLGRGGVEAAVGLMPELTALLRRKAGLLSGGEQQMLALARALALDPVVLLADELSLGLAPMIVERLLRAVRNAADRGVGVLLVEQQVRQALAIADRAYVLRRGEVVMSGTASEIGSRLDEIEDTYLSAARTVGSDLPTGTAT